MKLLLEIIDFVVTLSQFMKISTFLIFLLQREAKWHSQNSRSASHQGVGLLNEVLKQVTLWFFSSCDILRF